MGKMSKLICVRHDAPSKAVPKAEVTVTEKVVTTTVTEKLPTTTVVAREVAEISPEGRNRSQSDSVTMKSRINEKQELSVLNDHLAGYIERVHQLEKANRQLQVHIKRVEEQVITEHAPPAGVNLDQELQRIRDTTGKDMDKLRAENAMLKPELEVMRSRITELQQLGHDSERARIAAEAALGELNAKLNGLENEKLMWERENLAIQAENQRLNQGQRGLENLLAQERDVRMIEGQRLEGLLTEFEQFKLEHEKILETKAQEYMEKLEVTRTELAGQHQAELQDALIKLRQEMNDELAQSRKPIQDMYENKLALLTSELDIFRANYTDAASQLQTLGAEALALRTERGLLLERVNVLEQDVSRLQSELSSTAAKYNALMQQAEADRTRLGRELQDLMKKYADLMDAKVQLHNEIATYRNLLENEELHMHQWEQRLKVMKTTERTTVQQNYIAV